LKEVCINNSAKYLVYSIGHKPLDGTGRIAIECVEQKDTSGDTITHITSEWGVGGESSGGGVSGGVGGGGSSGISYFSGSAKKNVRGIVFYDQYGRPVYEWRENAGGSRITRKTSYLKP